jgi:hypothetical protein
LELHVPKAAHSVREFAVELMTIVAGIVIAIGLEQAVEALRWHEKANTARGQFASAKGRWARRERGEGTEYRQPCPANWADPPI